MADKIVLAISGSLRAPSFTEKMLDLCIEGMGSGIKVRKFYPHKMHIGPCKSCWHCWKGNKGDCIQQDDFNEILETFKVADYFIVAAPVYTLGLPATVKNVLDRFFITLLPTQVLPPGGPTKHPSRLNHHPKTVLISSCGFAELSNFDSLSESFRQVCYQMEWSWAGQILISAAGASVIPALFNKKYRLIKEAGAELVAGEIKKATTDSIAEPVLSDEDYRQFCSSYFDGGVRGNIKCASIIAKYTLSK